jgi:type III restriction enzyme
VDKPQTLYAKYDTASEGFIDFKSLVPSHVTDNLAYPLRPYQEEAVGRWMYYYDNDPNKKMPAQLLFNMATGSGKTLVMAGLIIDLYKRGRRNFIFFVNSTNIIEKTKDNFLNPASSKYLFAQNLLIDGEKVAIRSVQNFNESDPNAINILFTTIQGLHSDLNNPRENRLTYSEMEDYEIVMIGDEAHHNNATTMLDSKDKEDNASWEATVNNIMKTAQKPILLEFTATIDMSDASIFQKYYERIIYKYDLRAFRLDGYSKDPIIYDVDSDLLSRCLQAIIISQYRKKIALKNNVWLKPVVMFKSKTIAESKTNHESFTALIKELSAEQVKAQVAKAGDILQQAFDCFASAELSFDDLVAELKNDFCEERTILIDGNNVTSEKQLLLNSLEDKNNEIRAVFAVDMLNEGWDVLNLFDIVRLYDTRDSKAGKVGKTTIREAQLIGRGARYYPFVVDSDTEHKYVRKFDENENEELRAIEQLHYHSAHNPKYIQEIRQALVQTGLMSSETTEREMKLKQTFKNTETYKAGVVWVNERLTKKDLARAKQMTFIEDEYELPSIIEVTLKSGLGRELSIFDGNADEQPVNAEIANKELKISRDIPLNVVRASINRNRSFKFDRLSQAIPFLPSTDAFIKMLGKVRIIINGSTDEINSLSQEQKLAIMDDVLSQIEGRFKGEDEQYVGSEKFIKQPFNETFKDVKRKYSMDENSDREFGMPQFMSRTHALNLSAKDWYVYDENYGTSEEKSLVVMLDSIMDELSEKWNDIYLVRNEKAVTIYSFNEGRPFEPDYILFANDKKTGNINWQIFIEPKGEQFLDADGKFDNSKEGWKQKFLLDIESRFDVTVLREDSSWKVLGVPFYNEEYTRAEVSDRLKELS